MDAEELLLPRVARANRGAIDRCIEAYGPLVWSMARRMTHTPADAEDAVQEIFLDLWKHAARFNPAVNTEKVFVTMLARRRLIDRIRKTRRQLAAQNYFEARQTPEDHLTGDNIVERDAEIADARRILAELPEPHQEAITMSLLEGLSHAEIATRTGWPLGTVKTVLRRGILRLQSASRRADWNRTEDRLSEDRE
jgi:RNA polymerase sigma-70 factor (ECF subfamily)